MCVKTNRFIQRSIDAIYRSVDNNIERKCSPVSQFYIITRESICITWDVSIWLDVFILEGSLSRSFLGSFLFSPFFPPQYFDPFVVLAKMNYNSWFWTIEGISSTLLGIVDMKKKGLFPSNDEFAPFIWSLIHKGNQPPGGTFDHFDWDMPLKQILLRP